MEKLGDADFSWVSGFCSFWKAVDRLWDGCGKSQGFFSTGLLIGCCLFCGNPRCGDSAWYLPLRGTPHVLFLRSAKKVPKKAALRGCRPFKISPLAAKVVMKVLSCAISALFITGALLIFCGGAKDFPQFLTRNFRYADFCT